MLKSSPTQRKMARYANKDLQGLLGPFVYIPKLRRAVILETEAPQAPGPLIRSTEALIVLGSGNDEVRLG